MRYKTVHSFMERAFEQYKNLPAVEEAGEVLTYGCLKKEIEETLQFFNKIGIVKGECIGLYMEHSIELVISVIALLETGAVYVPLDPEYPEKRIEYIVENCGCRKILVTERTEFTKLKENMEIVNIRDRKQISIGADAIRPQIAESDVAYILFTSGSTGKPQGVVTTHVNLCSVLEDGQKAIPIKPRDKVMWKTSICFAFGIYELYWSLFFGGCICVSRRDERKDPVQIREFIKNRGIQIVTFVPTLLNRLLEYDYLKECSSLKSILCAGEPMIPGMIEEFYRKCPGILYNVYGMTELTGYVLWQECNPGTDVSLVGAAIDHISCLVLSEELSVLAPGEEGILYISGPNVSQGYYENDPLTKERYVSFGVSVYFKTNDRFIQQERGYRFIGRADDLIKVNGNRIERIEIEKTVSAHPQVRENAVCVDEQGKIVDFFVLEQNADEKSVLEAIKTYLASRLPQYMLPSQWIALSALPVLPNGKMNKVHLKELLEEYQTKEVRIEAKTPIQKFLLRLYQDILRNSFMNMSESLLELGATSMDLMDLVFHINTICGTEITVEELFSNASILKLEELIHEKRKKEFDNTEFVFSKGDKYLPFELTELQQSYYFDHANAGEFGNDVTYGYAELECTEYDTLTFKNALKQVINRHDLLHSKFEHSQICILREPVEENIEEFTLAEGKAGQEALNQQRERLKLQKLPLDRAPLFRCIANRIEGGAILQLYFDAMIIDGLSFNLLIKELGECYKGVEKKELSCSFLDFVEYKKWVKTTEEYQRAKDFWGHKVQQLPPPLELPLKNKTGDRQVRKGTQEVFTLNEEQCRKLSEHSREVNVTLFGTLVSSFTLAVSLWSEKRAFTICVPKTERPRISEDFSEMIGEFSTFFPLEIIRESGELFRQFAGRVNHKIAEAQTHHLFSGIELIREMSSRSGELRSGVIPVIFTSLLDEKPEEYEDPFNVRHFESHTSNTYLEVVVHKNKNGLQIAYNYAEDLIDPDMIRTISEVQRKLLHALEDGSMWEQPVRLPLPQRDKRIIEQANETKVKFQYRNMSELVMKSLKNHAGRVAIQTLTEKITYQELEQAVHQIAGHFMEHVAGEKSPIAIVTKNGIAQIFGMVSCLLCGIPYMPLEAEAPVNRLVACMENAKCRFVLCDDEESGEMWRKKGFEPIMPEEILKRSVNAKACIPPVCQEEDLFTVIHTSGSTGTPKAVMIRHGGVLNCIEFTNRKFGVGEKDAAIALTNSAHDMSMFDVWGMLLAGGKIVLPEAEKRKDPIHWMELIKACGVTIWNSVPVMMEMFIEVLRTHRFIFENQVRLVILGGDYMKLNLPPQIWKLFGRCKVVNVGGPTETTLWNIYHEVTVEDIENKLIPYGYPIQNTNYHILNELMDEVPLGVTGELYCSGIGVTGGYLGNEEMTEKNFIRHHGQRLYHTGDRGRYLDNGEIEFKGRNDFQVKINGKRIELEEITNTLLKQEAVSRCQVIYDYRNRELVAFYQGQKPDVRALAQELPTYMIPGSFYEISEFPLTTNKKIDRQQLLRLTENKREEATQSKEILSTTEVKVKELFTMILNKDSIAKEDNFLMIGGDSLKALTLMHELRKEFCHEIRPSDFFAEPTIAATARRLEETNREELTEVGFELEPEHTYEPFELSELQEAYLVGRKSEMQLGCVSTYGYLEMECTEYDQQRFTEVIHKVVERHAMLRCVISYEGTQRFYPEIPVISIPQKDIRRYGKEKKAQYLKHVRREMTAYRLELEQIPLARVKVTWVEERLHVIHIYFDTIIIDGYSYEILYNEMEELYADPGLQLTPLTLTFRDYIRYKKTVRMTQRYEMAKEYWLKRIPNLPEAVSLPLLCDPGEIKKIEGDLRVCRLTADEWVHVERAARKRGVSTFIVLFTAFSLVIARWNRNRKFLLNIPEFDRPLFHPEIEKLVGECSTFLLFEVEAIPGESFLETCERNQKQLWEIKEHSLFTGMEVLREIYRYRNSYGNALVPIVFSSLLDLPQAPRNIFRTRYTQTHTTQVWIDIDAQRCNDEIQFNWNCVKGLFDSDMLEEMVTMQMELLRKAAYEEEFWSEPLEVRLPRQEQTVIDRANNTTTYLPFHSMQKLLADSFAEHREKTALICEGIEYSYGHLWSMVRATAEELLDRGVGPGKNVAVLLEKGISQVVYVLAAVWIGAVYAPIEYDSPINWVRSCLENMDCALLITDSAKKTALKELSYPILDIEISRQPSHSVSFYDASEEDIFAIIHTSGSTGRPKAVMVQQKGIQNCIEFTLEKFQINSEDSMLALTNLAHDMSIFDLFGMLLAGGKIIMPDAKRAKDPIYWIEQINIHKITVWNTVPAMLQMLMEVTEALGSSSFDSYRRVISGGDYVEPALVRKLRRQMPNAIFISVGGPTETTLWNIYHVITEKDMKSNTIPYGRPIANNAYHLLNDNMQSVPLGVKGMMYCSGIGVTMGYRNDEEATRKNYMLWEGKRLYRTGDLGVYDKKGDILFKGREDYQVKIQGKRIDLKTIEKTMAAYREVSTVAVKVNDENHTIMGYYRSPMAYKTEEWMDYLKQQLPPYMVPSAYQWMEHWPLNAAGKLDRKQLQVISGKSIQEETARELTDQERKVLIIARRILNKEEIGITDDFFFAGGNSLMAIRFCNEIRKEFALDYSLTELFIEPHFQTIARKVELGGRENQGKEVLRRDWKIEPGVSWNPDSGEDIEYVGFLSKAQEGIWLHEMFYPSNRFTLTGMVDIRGSVDIERLRLVFREMIGRHDVLRCRICTDNNFNPIQIIHAKKDAIIKERVFETEQELDWALEERKKYRIAIDGEQLYSVELWKLHNSHYKLVMSFHHAICDEGSFQILVDEMYKAYRGEAVNSSEVRYCDFAAYSREEEFPSDYWKAVLRDADLLELPHIGRAQDFHAAVGRTYSIPIKESEMKQLNALFKEHGLTLYMGFYALFVKFLHQVTARQKLYIGSPVSIREQYGLDGVMGTFAHQAVFAFSIEEDMAFDGIAKQVKKVVAETMEHATVPFEYIAQQLKCDTDTKNIPYHIHYNYVDESRPGSGGKEDEWMALDYIKNTIQHNLGLYVERREDNVTVQLVYKDSYIKPEQVIEYGIILKDIIVSKL